ncbi:hypothetical protein [Aquimarina rhabdastrellae]
MKRVFILLLIIGGINLTACEKSAIQEEVSLEELQATEGDHSETVEEREVEEEAEGEESN